MLSFRLFELVPFSVESTGGLTASAVELIRAMASASAELLHMWTTHRPRAGGVDGIAVQRGIVIVVTTVHNTQR